MNPQEHRPSQGQDFESGEGRQRQEQPSRQGRGRRNTDGRTQPQETENRFGGQFRNLWPTPKDGHWVNVGNAERIISVAAGAAMTGFGTRDLIVRRNLLPAGLDAALTTVGGYLLFRGISGHCFVNDLFGRDSAWGQQEEVQLQATVTVQAPRPVVYEFWRHLENLPRFMQYLESVRQVNPRISHWVAAVNEDFGRLEWDSEIIHDEPGRFIAWRSLPGSDIFNAGEVRFEDAPGNRGTEVHAIITYKPPMGAAGKIAAEMLNPVFKKLVKDDLLRFKQVIETGEVANNQSPNGRGQRQSLFTKLSSLV